MHPLRLRILKLQIHRRLSSRLRTVLASKPCTGALAAWKSRRATASA